MEKESYYIGFNRDKPWTQAELEEYRQEKQRIIDEDAKDGVFHPNLLTGELARTSEEIRLGLEPRKFKTGI